MRGSTRGAGARVDVGMAEEVGLRVEVGVELRVRVALVGACAGTNWSD